MIRLVKQQVTWLASGALSDFFRASSAPTCVGFEYHDWLVFHLVLSGLFIAISCAGKNSTTLVLDFSNSLLDSNGWIFPIFYFLSSTEWENLHRKPFLFSHERWGFLLKIFPPIHSSYGGAIPAWPAALAAAKAWRCCSAGRAMPKPGGDARGMGIYWGYLHEKSRLWEHVHLFDGKLQEEHGTRIYRWFCTHWIQCSRLYTAISVTNGITSGTYDYQGHQLLTNSVAFDLFNCKVKGSESSGAQLSYLVGRLQVASTKLSPKQSIASCQRKRLYHSTPHLITTSFWSSKNWRKGTHPQMYDQFFS